MFSNTAKFLFLAMILLAQTAQAAPVFSIFELGIAEGQNARYDAVARENIRASVRGETGTLAMYSLKNAQDENTAYMVELYADEAAYQAHRVGKGYAAFLQAAPQILGDKKIKLDLTPQFLGDKTVKQTAATRANLVGVTVKPEHAAAFRKIVMDEMKQSLAKENGVRAIYAATDAKQPEKWVFFEIYASAAYQQHRATPHFQDYLRQTADMVAEKSFTETRPALLMNKGGAQFEAE